MVLTDEDIANIKLPLSDETYVNLHETEVSRGQFLFKFLPEKLNDAFEYMEIDCFNKKYGESAAAVPTDSISWQPPQTEKYKDYPSICHPREEALRQIAEWHKKHPDC